MNALSFQRLQTRAAAIRRKVFGTTAEGEEQRARMEDGVETFACYFSPVRTQEQLDAVGFKDVHDTILRVLKAETAFVPTIGKLVRLVGVKADGSDLVIRISEIAYAGANVEWVVGTKAEF